MLMVLPVSEGENGEEMVRVECLAWGSVWLRPYPRTFEERL
jgi:hypothetical protein